MRDHPHECRPAPRPLSDLWWVDQVRRLRRWWRRDWNRLDAVLWSWTYDADPTQQPKVALIGELDGEFYLPSRTRPDWWDRPLRLRYPHHWPTYLRSRRLRTYVWLEAGA